MNDNANAITLTKDEADYLALNIDWNYVCTYDEVPEGIMRKFHDRLDWLSVSACQRMSEQFMRDFQDKIRWECIRANPNIIKLSPEFLEEFKDRLG